MSSESRDEQLALFREVTGVEDNAVAQYTLNKYHWDVQLAVQEYLAGLVDTSMTQQQQPLSTPISRPVPPANSGRNTSMPLHRRSISPGDRRTAAARNEGKSAAAAAAEQDHQLDDSVDSSDARHDNDDDGRAPLLGASAANRQPMGGGGGGAARAAMPPPTATVTTTSMIILPFKVIGLVLRGILYPVRLITGGGQEGPDPLLSARYFIESFQRDYGRRHPNFIRGSFQDATRQAQRENKFLVVYLHSPMHEDTPNFCRQTLASETFVSFLDENLLIWGGSIHYADAYLASQHLDAAAFPFLTLLACQPPNIQVLDHMEGAGGVETVLQRLTAAMQRHQDVLERQLIQQRERQERIRLQEEQNREYQEALEADRRREAQLQADRARKLKDEEEARIKAEQTAALEARTREETEMALRTKRARLPPEPPATDKSTIRLRLQFPHGRKSDRRFNPFDTIQVVRDYIDIYVADNNSNDEVQLVNYSLSTPYPKRTFDDASITLQDAGLHSADTIYITDLDA